ncbi:hypothetical protein HYV49_00995 [Candidatus Pacearchaeota archaeon]|nr:hypothetical protein [Candidatus Pacearchaeota archaeon]
MSELLIFAYLGINKKETINVKMPKMWFVFIFNLVKEEPLRDKEAIKAGYYYLLFAMFILIILIVLAFKWINFI